MNVPNGGGALLKVESSNISPISRKKREIWGTPFSGMRDNFLSHSGEDHFVRPLTGKSSPLEDRKTSRSKGHTWPAAGKMVTSQYKFPFSILGIHRLALSTASCSGGAMIDFRDERPRDQKAIFHVVSCAFAQMAEAQLIDELREGGDAVISPVADEDGQVVGHGLLCRLDAPFRH